MLLDLYPYRYGSGTLKYWTGTEWVVKPLYYWNGSQWVYNGIKRYDGGQWK